MIKIEREWERERKVAAVRDRKNEGEKGKKKERIKQGEIEKNGEQIQK